LEGRLLGSTLSFSRVADLFDQLVRDSCKRTFGIWIAVKQKRVMNTIPPIEPLHVDTQRPMWSVMIPIDRPNICWLREALSGPLGTGLGPSDMQIALVDDASERTSGGDVEIFWRECEERGIQIHRFTKRAGLAGNWNRCLQLSRGHLVHILHQDDRVRPEFYKATVAGLEAAPSAGASFTQHMLIGDNEASIRSGRLDRAEPGLLDDWLEGVVANLTIQSATIVVRRAVYEQLGGFDETYNYFPDQDMWQRIAAEYPLWFDPGPLAESRVCERSGAGDRIRRIGSWLEMRRLLYMATKRISPPVRQRFAKSARGHLVRFAIAEVGCATKRLDFRASMVALAGATVVGMGDISDLVQGRLGTAPTSRLPPRTENIKAARLPRMLLLTEFYPEDPTKCVHGVFQRLQRHIEVLSGIGPVDAVFFWPEHQMSPEDIVKQTQLVKELWPIKGTVRFIKAGGGRRGWLDWIADAFWVFRGAVGFFFTAPTMRTCRREQAAELRHSLEELQPDLIFAHRIGAAASLLRVRLPLPPTVVDIDDLEHEKLRRLGVSTPHFASRFGILAQASLAIHALRRISAMATCLLVTSELDQTKLQAACRTSVSAIIPNAAFCSHPLLKARDPIAFFVGMAAYPPNREAILWLLREIWPLVREAIPDARLLVAGEDTKELVAQGKGQGVEGLGFVVDLASIYERVRVALCPIRHGGGTRIKIIEAAMHARPVVSTVLGAEGLSFVPESEILLDDTAVGFARACIKLLRDPDLAATIGEAARRRAQAHYAPDRVVERLTSLCVGLVDGTDRTMELTAARDTPPKPIEIGQWPKDATQKR
jgi:glycosyltransferase involved in cell wall biosynthesis